MARDFIIDGKFAKNYMKKTKDSATTRRMLKFILENAHFTKDKVVADLAAGSGNYAIHLKDKVKRIDAVDISDEMIRIMQKLFHGDNRVKVIKDDITSMDLDSDSYDVVLLIMSLHHIAKAEQVLEETSRILKPGGIFILIDRIAKDKAKADEFDKSEKQMKEYGHGHGQYQRTEQEIESLLNKRFKIIKKQEMPYPDERQPILTRFLYALEKK
jgi:ubiquinone/menaquinone biosynthesis C-methylase UbiE